ncbi:MAG: hypothetical protein HKN87_11395 [Saprospiraceae bacterium]|nr:hypothetical protein [Saprospiraceae bacterium]
MNIMESRSTINQSKKIDAKDIPKWKSYLKKIGIVGFLFFLIKGLIWLAVLFFIKEQL